MNKITNRQAICDTLLKAAKTDPGLVVLCSDSRGSASLTPFFKEYPDQSYEVGIAEQNLVSVSAGMASCGKKVFAASPASFLSTRSYEQAEFTLNRAKVIAEGADVTLVACGEMVPYAVEARRILEEKGISTGLGAPYWDSRAPGLLTGITRTTGKNEIAKACLESIVYQITDLIHLMREESGEKLEEIRVDGGPTANEYLMQFQSDMAVTFYH